MPNFRENKILWEIFLKRDILIKILLNSLSYFINKFKKVFKNEGVFRQEFFLSLILIAVGFLIGETVTQKILLIFSIIIINLVEILNTTIEPVIEKISIENHLLSKRLKDIASAATFLVIGNAFITWALILFF